MKRFIGASLFCVLLCAGSVFEAKANSGYVYAAANQSKNKVQSKSKQSSSISSAQAASIARSKHGGKVLKVNRSGAGYKVKLIKPNGRVTSVYVDGRKKQ